MSYRVKRMLFSLIPPAIILVAVWGTSIWKDRQAATQELENFSVNLLGLSEPTKNRLASGYLDKDADLVADSPSTDAELLDPSELTFCYVPDPEAESQDWSPLLSSIQAATGKVVKAISIGNFEQQLQQLHGGDLHIAGINTGSVPRAANVAGFVPLVTFADSEKKFGYTMKIIVAESSDIQSIEDLKGKSISFTSMNSNSGFKAPVMLLYNDFDMQPNRDYEYGLSTSHDLSIQGIAKGRLQAAAVASDMLDRATERGEISDSDFRVIYTSDRFPSASIGVPHNLKPELREQILDALVSFDASQLQGILGSNIKHFVPVSYKDDWTLIRETDDALGIKHKLPAPE